MADPVGRWHPRPILGFRFRYRPAEHHGDLGESVHDQGSLAQLAGQSWFGQRFQLRESLHLDHSQRLRWHQQFQCSRFLHRCRWVSEFPRRRIIFYHGRQHGPHAEFHSGSRAFDLRADGGGTGGSFLAAAQDPEPITLNSAVEASAPRSRERERVDSASTAESRMTEIRFLPTNSSGP